MSNEKLLVGKMPDITIQLSRNIQFNYLYRDGGNFKIFGHEIFLNPKRLALTIIETQIRNNLIDGLYFEPSSLKVRRLKHDDWIRELDHNWNEFESLELTMEEPTVSITIDKFLLLTSRIWKY